MNLLAPASDTTHRITNLLQIITLAGLLWIGFAIERQIALTNALLNQEHPMSTPYTDTSGLTHTVSTPYREEGLAEAHRLDLCESFKVFPPASPPEWYNPEEPCR